jgi:hypothetical protein
VLRPLLACVLVLGCGASPAPIAAPVAAPARDWSGLFAFARDQKWGYIDRTGAIVVPPTYDAAGSFSEGLGAVSVGGKYGFIDVTGAVVIEPHFDHATAFSDGLAAVTVGTREAGRVGFIDRSGAVVIEPRFHAAGAFSDGLAAVLTGARWTVGPQPCGPQPPSEGWTGGAWAFIDVRGTVVIDSRAAWDPVDRFSHGLAVVTERGGDRRKHYIDRTGKRAFPGNFYNAWPFADGLAPVMTEQDWGSVGFIDRRGYFVISPRFDEALGFAEGLAPVSIEQRWGYVDAKGTIIIAPRFEAAGPFVGGLARVFTRTADGQHLDIEFIDRTGRVVFSLGQIGSANGFEDGLAWAADGYINPEGAYVFRW